MYFEFQRMNLAGDLIGAPLRVNTDTGILMQCHPSVDVKQIQHLCDIARATPDYPVDLTCFTGPRENRSLVWNARIYYRNRGK